MCLVYWYEYNNNDITTNIRITNNTTQRILKMMLETELESSKLVITYGYLISNTRIFYDICEPSDIVSL